ncbi:MAG TPA: SDR family NAD(P)-dependent oxidoreductase, partial [Telluria sp.]
MRPLRRGIEADSIAADLSEPAAIAAFAQGALDRLGQVDILVNNAGATWGAPAEDYPLEAWDKVMDLNVRGIFLLSQAIGRMSMIPRRSGRIVNIASIAGLAGNPPGTMQTIAYNTSKAALI